MVWTDPFRLRRSVHGQVPWWHSRLTTRGESEVSTRPDVSSCRSMSGSCPLWRRSRTSRRGRRNPAAFDLTLSGTDHLLTVVQTAGLATSAASARVGGEFAGHYHRGLCSLDRYGVDVVA